MRSHDSGSSYGEPARPAPSPVELARDAIVDFDRDTKTKAIHNAVEAVGAAHAANNAEQWTKERSRLDAALRGAARSQERARARAHDASPELKQQLEAAERELSELQAAAQTFTEAPTGFVRLSVEDQLLEVLPEGPIQNARQEMQRAEIQAKAILDGLSTADTLALQHRLRRNYPTDELARRFKRLGGDRQAKLQHLLDDPKRRARVRATEATAKAADATAHVEAEGEHAPPIAVPQPASSTSPDLADEAMQAPTAKTEDARVASTNQKQELSQQEDAQHYYALHWKAFAANVRAHLTAAHLETGSSRVTWTHGAERFVEQLSYALFGPDPSELPGVLYPSDPWRLIDDYRVMVAPKFDGGSSVNDSAHGATLGAMGWIPEIGVAIAGAFELAVRNSIPRMTARYATASGTASNGVTAGELIASHPMDRVVAAALCEKDVVTVNQTAKPRSKRRHDVQTDGLRSVSEFEWLGARDPALWNWIRPKDPSDATLEEVALALWDDTQFAYGLTIVGGCVKIPVDWAHRLTQAHAYEPPAKIVVPGEPRFLPESPGEQIAASALADDIALGEATRGHTAPAAADRIELIDALDSTGAMLEELRPQLDPWLVQSPIGLAQTFVRAKRAWLPSATSDQAKRWAPVFLGQHEIVRDASAGALQALELLTSRGLTPKELERESTHPASHVLRAYAEAVGTSHLVDTAHAALARAKAAHTMLELNLIEHARTDVARDLATLRASEAADPNTAGGRSAELALEQQQLAAESANLRSQAFAGHTPDPALVEAAALDAASLTFRARLGSLQHALGSLRSAAEAADEGAVAFVANAFSWSLKTLPFELSTVIADLQGVDDLLAGSSTAAVNAKYDALPPSDAREYARQFELRDTRRAQLDKAQHQFAEILRKRRISAGLFEEATKTIQDAHLRTLVGNVAVMLALAVASGGIASVVGDFAGGVVGGLRTATTIEEAAAVARTARIVGGVTSFVVDAAGNAAGQTALQGGHVGSTFVDNLLTNAVVMTALRPLQAIARTLTGLDEEAFKLWEQQGQRWKVLLAKAPIVSAELVTAVAAANVTQRLLASARGEKPDDHTLAMWSLEGATMGLGRILHLRLAASLERLRLAGSSAGELVGRTVRLMGLASKVENSGDLNAGMDMLLGHQQLLDDEIAFWRKVVDDPTSLRRLGMTHDQASLRLAGIESERVETRGWAFAQTRLRLAGLEQEVDGGRLWVGDTEDITIAIGEVKRAGAALEVGEHVEAANIWRVKIDDQEIVIRERARDGRAREAKPKGEVTAADVAHAKRYAAAARELRPVLEAQIKRVVDAGPDFSTETLQIGHSFGGVMNQDTRFEQGRAGDPRSHLIIYTHDGAMTGRGALPSGQAPDLQTMPGVRTREHTTDHASYAKSADLGDATEIGRLEMQTPAYKAKATKLERQDGHGDPPWAHVDRRLRVHIVDDQGTSRLIYCNDYENVGGMGPTDYGPAKKIIGEPGASEDAKREMFATMRETGVLVGGDDPDLSSKFHEGERVLVWGGSPTGGWAGEDAAMHGAQADVVGESPHVRRTANTPARETTAAEFETELRRASQDGNAEDVRRLLVEWRIRDTHSGSKLRRNQQTGATWGPGATQRGIHVELGVPTQMQLLPDGTVSVTIGVGEHPGPRIYDRVVMALGQDPGAPGGPAALQGKGVERGADGKLDMNAPVPDGTFALRMVLDKRQRLVGLESEDGSMQLKGAAYASPKLAPWVIPSERASFIEKARQIATQGERTHTGDAISADSAGVTTGIEAQRDRLPIANEILAARDYKLPKQVSADRLSLPKDHPEQWAERLEDFLTRSMRARPGRVQVTLLASGRDGVHLFHVENGGQDVGTLRVYDSMALADAEAQIAARVTAAVPTIEAGADRGTVAVDGGTAAQLTSHSRDPRARGATFGGMLDDWASAPDDATKSVAFDRMKLAVTRVAQTMADVHNHFAQEGRLMTPAAKQRDVHSVYAQLGSPEAARALGPEQLARVRAALPELEAAFMNGKIPATAELGNARADTFELHDYKVDKKATVEAKARHADSKDIMMFGKVSVEDIGGIRETIDPSTQKGTGTGAADLAQFLESLREDPHLDSRDGDTLTALFYETYLKAFTHYAADIGVATTWYRVATEIRGLASQEPGAASRLQSLLPRGGSR